MIDIRLSVGMSAAGPPGALVREADLALDAARGERAVFRVFDPQTHAAAANALSLMPELRAAIGAGHLALVHQPKFNLRTGAIDGVECLVRWRHAQFGAIPPGDFVTMAEETGDIDALSRWVLQRALFEQALLAEEGFTLPFAVNLSGRLLSDRAFVNWIMEQHLCSGGKLRLEITETAVIANPEQAFVNIDRLTLAGIPCSIDDYGAGLSSLAYLKQIKADELKLDKSLIDDVTRSARDALITKSTIDLAHSLGMKVVAEGIETAETASIVASMGCDLAQGYFFCRPVSLSKLVDRLREAATGAEDQFPVSRSRTAVFSAS